MVLESFSVSDSENNKPSDDEEEEAMKFLETTLKSDNSPLYNSIQIEDEYCNCFISLFKSLSLDTRQLEWTVRGVDDSH